MSFAACILYAELRAKFKRLPAGALVAVRFSASCAGGRIS